jgi:hypothetical protein
MIDAIDVVPLCKRSITSAAAQETSDCLPPLDVGSVDQAAQQQADVKPAPPAQLKVIPKAGLKCCWRSATANGKRPVSGSKPRPTIL